MSKSIFKSRTFWFNLAAAGLEVVNLLGVPLGIPPGTVILVVTAGNIVLRKLTDTPVHVITSPDHY